MPETSPKYVSKSTCYIFSIELVFFASVHVLSIDYNLFVQGLGSPVFDKLEAELAKAAMSLPATKGFEIGSGFAGTILLGFVRVI